MGERSGDAKKKFTVLDMSKYVDKELRVKFMGGREVVGILKGYDALLNLVLDETREYLKDPDDPYRLLDETRSLGLTVCRGTAVPLRVEGRDLLVLLRRLVERVGEALHPASAAPAQEATCPTPCAPGATRARAKQRALAPARVRTEARAVKRWSLK